MLKAVLMDIDDTLLDFGKCAEQAMRIGFAEWGLPYDDSTYATFTRINDGLWLMIERGELTTQQLFEFRWNRIFDALRRFAAHFCSYPALRPCFYADRFV